MKNKLYKKTIIAIITILLLLIFTGSIIKQQTKNKMNISENIGDENEVTVEANIPQLSAGMIPVKWDGSYWQITTKTDSDWYDYKNGKLAYVMLNDGVYQSELIRNMEENGQKLASENIGAQIQETELGTIFAWIPRYEYSESGEIKHVEDIQYARKDWNIPELFTYEREGTSIPDILLTGVWVRKGCRQWIFK